MDKRELAAFLRTRRERLRPEDAGLPPGAHRRTPGLRREEVAGLAHISVDHYSRLEQARGRNPSPQVLHGIARALRLTDQERAHLFRLAGERERERDGGPSREVAPATRTLLDRLGDAPAVVLDDTCRVLAWNPLAAALLGDFAALGGPDRNLLRRYFLHGGSGDSAITASGHGRFVVTAVSYLRVAAARYPDSAEIRALVAELAAASEEFAALWESRELRIEHHTRQRFAHPEVGEIELDFDVLAVPDRDQHLVIFTAEPGSSAQEALRLLKVVGTRRMDVPA